MKSFVKAMDDLPYIIKILLCLPAVDVVWWIYRAAKSLDAKENGQLIVAIIFLIIGIPFIWIFDMICVLFGGKVWWY